MRITVKTRSEAMAIAESMIGKTYHDTEASDRVGYPIYRAMCGNAWISDLNTRLEVNDDSETVNIWIDANRDVTESDLAEVLRIIDDAIYQIDDNILRELQAQTGIDKARAELYGAYKKVAEILDAKFPDSDLYAKYNL